jgi:hypothetical protein
MERGPLSLVSTNEELLGQKKSSGSGLESREYDRRDPSRWQRGTLHPLKLVLTLLTSGSLSRTQATEFFLISATLVSVALYQHTTRFSSLNTVLDMVCHSPRDGLNLH